MTDTTGSIDFSEVKSLGIGIAGCLGSRFDADQGFLLRLFSSEGAAEQFHDYIRRVIDDRLTSEFAKLYTCEVISFDDYLVAMVTRSGEKPYDFIGVLVERSPGIIHSVTHHQATYWLCGLHPPVESVDGRPRTTKSIIRQVDPWPYGMGTLAVIGERPDWADQLVGAGSPFVGIQAGVELDLWAGVLRLLYNGPNKVAGLLLPSDVPAEAWVFLRSLLPLYKPFYWEPQGDRLLVARSWYGDLTGHRILLLPQQPEYHRLARNA